VSPANDNSSAVRDLALPVIGMVAFDRRWAAGSYVGSIVAGGFDHAAIVTLRTLAASSGKSSAFTGGTETGNADLRPSPRGKPSAWRCHLAAMLADRPVRGGIVDRLA
jgi:hypothetical protein